MNQKRWVAEYPFNTLVGRLIDNYSEAKGYMNKMETRLQKTGRLDEFQDTVDRGVLRQLTRSVAEAYRGPVNYISIVEMFKAGPYATTLMRICMNSSMKQPSQSGVSLNDCLLKGPSALADLYTVTLGM
jgi:hypothetical protein